MNSWLKPYVPASVLRAALVLADHVDFWEEETFCINGKWRERELTDFIRMGLTADGAQKQRFRQLLLVYVEMSTRAGAIKEKELRVAVCEIRRWVRIADAIV